MKKEKYVEFIATFLIILILSIPFSAAKINSVSVKGGDGVEGYLKANDFINFIVQAAIEGTAIKAEEVKAGDALIFDKCSPLPSSGFECSLRHPSSGTDSFDGGILPYTVTLLKDDKKTFDDSKSGFLVVDNKAPQIKLSVSKSKFSSKDSIEIEYDATDFACNSPSCENKCVGLKTIEFYTLDGSFKKTEDITTNDCNVKSVLDIEQKSLKDGKNSIFARATDKFGQISSETSVTFSVDTTGPSILSNSFTITRKGISLNTFSSQNVPIEISVNISADDLALNSVIADLSQFNPSQNLKNARAACSQIQGGLSTCRWNINLRPGSPGTKSSEITAFDTSGNNGAATLTRELNLDNQGPNVQSLSTLTTKGTKVLARPVGNTVIAVFDELSGLSADEVYLDLDGNEIKASRCTKETAWTCSWEDVTIRNNAIMTIGSATTDVLGNNVNENKIAEVAVDATNPVLNSLNISSVGSTIAAFPGIFKIGDKIAVVANITEDNDVSAVADFSKFITDAKKVSGSCKKIEDNENICTWQTDSINLAASDFIIFNFTDSAGNSLIEKRALATLGLENAATPDFWANSISCSPKAVDRSLGTLISQRVYCQVKLRPKATAQVSTVFIGPAACTGDTSRVQSVDTFNKEIGSTAPIIKITLKKDELKLNEANITCSFNIFSKVINTNTITKNPEIENAKINLQFYNLPLGELGEEVQKKVDDAKKDALDLHKKIGALNKLLQISKKICQMFGIIYNVVLIEKIITTKIKGFGDIVSGTPAEPFIGPPLYLAGTASCYGQQSAETAADKRWTTGGEFCKFVNCQWAPGVLGKWQNYITEKINNLPGAERLPGPGAGNQPGVKSTQPQAGGGRTGLAGYMDPNDNLFTAVLFACIPGVIYGIDKYSQIKCLYADCLQNAVGKDGLPIKACEDQKNYATCKYIWGEVFALTPYTAVFDHFTGLAKEALSNPFAAIGIGIGAACLHTCPKKSPGSSAFYITCQAFKIASKAGEIFQNVKGIANEGFKIRQDYCEKLQLSEKAAEPTPDLSNPAKRS